MNEDDTRAVKPPCARDAIATIHGVVSLVFLAAAFVPALILLFNHSVAIGVIEIALLGGGAVTAVSVFCTKCPCRESCAHVLPGMISRKMPDRKGPYTVTELITVIVMFALPVLFPHVWLVRDTVYFAAFWFLLTVGIVEIMIFVCPRCGNNFCPSYRIWH